MLRQMISALPPKELKSHFLPLEEVQKNHVRILTIDALGRMLDGAGQLVAVSRIPFSIRRALVFVLSRRNAIGRMLVNAETAGQLALLSRTWLFVHLIE